MPGSALALASGRVYACVRTAFNHACRLYARMRTADRECALCVCLHVMQQTLKILPAKSGTVVNRYRRHSPQNSKAASSTTSYQISSENLHLSLVVGPLTTHGPASVKSSFTKSYWWKYRGFARLLCHQQGPTFPSTQGSLDIFSAIDLIPV